MESVASHLEQLDLDFSSDNVIDWAYPSPEKGVLPYSKGINYFSLGLSIPDLDKSNMKEARSVGYSDTSFSLNGNGLWAGLVYWEPGMNPKEDEPIRSKFERSVPMDEAISGDQPPITGFYPRVVFPPEGEFRYALMLNYDEGVFGTSFENHTIEIPGGTSPRSVIVPDEIKCENGVKAALSGFLNEYFKHEYSLPSGEYTLNMEIERMPCLGVRTDGYRPLHSKLAFDGDVKLELPINRGINFRALKVFSNGGRTPRANPLERYVGNEKYIEMPFILPSDNPGKFMLIGSTSLEYQGNEDNADLVYVSLRRDESISETVTNPHLGLVEMQVSRVLKVSNVTVSYEPKYVEPLKNPFDSLADHLRLNSSDCLTMRGPAKGFYLNSTPVNTGKTVLANARTGAVSPKVEAEWDRHLQTFRFCLTNHL